MSVAVRRVTPASATPSFLTFLRTADAAALSILVATFALIVAVTWRKWGNPEIDAGAELTTADLVAHGATPYDDVRYFYGPLGLYALAGAFRVFGASFAVAFAFGLIQAAAIFGVFYALARQWLKPLSAGLATAVLLSIGFSGTAFNFVLPHTNSATIGMLFVLLELLALARRRPWLAGAALGFVALTRPEFLAVGAAVAVAYALGEWRENDRAAAGRALVRLGSPAVLVAGAVLGAFGLIVGWRELFLENLWPIDFIREAGFRSQEHWMPLDVDSLVGLVGRGCVYGALFGGLVAGAVVPRWRGFAGTRALAIVATLAAALAALAALDGTARLLGWFPEQRVAIEFESRNLLIGMSWLPFLAAVTAGYATLLFLRRRPAPFSTSWAVDLALVTAAGALGLRAYNAFTGEGSYAPYYAAPLVLLAGILHDRVAERWPAAKAAALGALGAIAVGLALYSVFGLYADRTAPVETARGTYIADGRAGSSIQTTVRLVLAATEPGEAILAAPSDGGLYFMTDRPPALAELMLLPGLLDARADELAAIRELQGRGVGLVVVGARDFAPYGFDQFGVDYNTTLGAWLRANALRTVRVGSFEAPAAGTYPSRGFDLYAFTSRVADRLRSVSGR